MQIEPLIYPVNYLRHNTINALSLLFSRVSVISLTEDEELSPCRTPDYHTGLYVHRIVTSPVGKKLKRFRKMLDQMRTWGEQMGLDNKSVAESIHTEAFQPAAESISSILTSIKKKKVEDPLLRTRIFLQIALENDIQDDLVEVEVKKLEEKRQRLTEIMGDNVHEEEPGISMPPEPVTANLYGIKMLNMPEKRLKAWMKLANRYDDTPLDTWPLGESLAVKDIVDRAYEKATGRIAADVLNLRLPAEAIDSGLKAKISEGLSKLLYELKDELKKNGGEKIEKNDLIKNICNRIEIIVAKETDSKRTGPTFNVTVYPGMHMDDLLPLSARLKKRKRPPKLFADWCMGSFYLL